MDRDPPIEHRLDNLELHQRVIGHQLWMLQRSINDLQAAVRALQLSQTPATPPRSRSRSPRRGQ
eukprot:11487070-Karenia_brevis.AAC.1